MVSKMLKEQNNKHVLIGQTYFGDAICHGHETQLWKLKLWSHTLGCLENVSLFGFKALDNSYISK